MTVAHLATLLVWCWAFRPKAAGPSGGAKSPHPYEAWPSIQDPPRPDPPAKMTRVLQDQDKEIIEHSAFDAGLETQAAKNREGEIQVSILIVGAGEHT